MEFKEAFRWLILGRKIKRKGWTGYWVTGRDIYSPTAKDTIFMHCKNGEVLDIRHTDDVTFTVSNMAANDWEVLPEDKEEEA